MTIAISLKVHDGVVLAADSASTLYASDRLGAPGVINVYNTANKVFNLYKGLPIGAITWGSGSIGRASISTLVKDLRRRLMSWNPPQPGWAIEPANYAIKEVADRARRFFFEEQYVPAFKDFKEKPFVGFMIAGYSAGQDLAEEWRIQIMDGQCTEAEPIRDKEVTGISWSGEPEAITRILMGHGTGLPRVLKELRRA